MEEKKFFCSNSNFAVSSKGKHKVYPYESTKNALVGRKVSFERNRVPDPLFIAGRWL
jgi:hypothetical protein